MNDDLISRQAAIDALGKDVMGGLNYQRILRELPSAEPTIPMLDAPISEWIPIYSSLSRDAKRCERCGYEAPLIVIGYHLTGNVSPSGDSGGTWEVETKRYLPRFCPNCGTRMRGADNE